MTANRPMTGFQMRFTQILQRESNGIQTAKAAKVSPFDDLKLKCEAGTNLKVHFHESSRPTPGRPVESQCPRPYCTLSATNRNSPSALDTSSSTDFLPSCFSWST